jgi:hypothetical protein
MWIRPFLATGPAIEAAGVLSVIAALSPNAAIDEGLTREEIDAETEMLRDRPYVDAKIVRMSEPFTVESLSPHRALTSPDDLPDSGPPSNRVLGPLRRARD